MQYGGGSAFAGVLAYMPQEVVTKRLPNPGVTAGLSPTSQNARAKQLELHEAVQTKVSA